MDDATAHVAGLLEANPALESKGSYVLDRGIVGSVGSQLSVPAEETGVSASYVPGHGSGRIVHWLYQTSDGR
ncbi:hypothetical protein H9L21_06975 [Aeromicrobium senzhongii]|uniref:Uncharacterized protein n=1 Tax=Aeromicrobium senzhongii TaxID=2663859 RepID=A0ABX6SW57_9ACTN|nr:hypothetical protein [Aeromicrobium senzhongii]MTB87293.1 hypothetical protein [Aeromicrobium senzhongii]QNL95641.1 hypothetical protein H9L21_06975 [Aeromicrobium senzhongii]